MKKTNKVTKKSTKQADWPTNLVAQQWGDCSLRSGSQERLLKKRNRAETWKVGSQRLTDSRLFKTQNCETLQTFFTQQKLHSTIWKEASDTFLHEAAVHRSPLQETPGPARSLPDLRTPTSNWHTDHSYRVCLPFSMASKIKVEKGFKVFKQKASRASETSKNPYSHARWRAGFQRHQYNTQTTKKRFPSVRNTEV